MICGKCGYEHHSIRGSCFKCGAALGHSSVHDELQLLKTMIEEVRKLQQMWEKALESTQDEHKREGGKK